MVWKKVKNIVKELVYSEHHRKDHEETGISVFSAEPGQHTVKYAWHIKCMEILMKHWAGIRSEIASISCPGWDQSYVCNHVKPQSEYVHINETNLELSQFCQPHLELWHWCSFSAVIWAPLPGFTRQAACVWCWLLLKAQNHRILESFRLEKTLKTIESNR